MAGSAFGLAEEEEFSDPLQAAKPEAKRADIPITLSNFFMVDSPCFLVSPF
ncbi:hypothetical protein D3C73_1518360 [compost metagenome]